MGGVGGEKDVLWGAVGELLGERGGGAEGGDEMDAGGALVLGGERGHDGLEIGGAGDLELFGLGAEWKGGSYEEREKENSEDLVFRHRERQTPGAKAPTPFGTVRPGPEGSG